MRIQYSLFFCSMITYAGCAGDVCEQAANIVKDCGFSTNVSEPVDETPADKQECSGDAERQSKCIVDHQDLVCQTFNPNNQSPAQNALTECIGTGASSGGNEGNGDQGDYSDYGDYGDYGDPFGGTGDGGGWDEGDWGDGEIWP